MKQMPILQAGVGIVSILIFACLVSAQTTTRPAPGGQGNSGADNRAALTGRILGSDHAPLAGAEVSLFNDDSGQNGYPLIATVRTDAQGRFAVSGETNGNRIIFAAMAEGYGFTIGSAPHVASDPIELELRKAVGLRVQVIDANANAAAGVRVGVFNLRDATGVVSAIPSQVKSQLSQMTDELGFCTLTTLPRNGIAAIEVNDPRFLRATSTIDLPASGTMHLLVPLRVEQAAAVRGRIVSEETGQPIAGVRVTGALAGAAGSSGYLLTTATTDADGRYQLSQMRAGRLIIIPQPLAPLSSEFAGATSEPLQVDAGKIIDAPEIKLGKGVLVKGTVQMSGTGAAVAGATITVTRQASGQPTVPGNVNPATVSSADGTYQLRVVPGAYGIRAARINMEPGVSPSSAVEQFSAAAGGGEMTINLSLQAPGATRGRVATSGRPGGGPVAGTPIKGTVLDNTGAPVEGAEVWLSFPSDLGSEREAMGSGQRTSTDAAGLFELPVAGNGAALRVRKDDLRMAEPLTVSAANRDIVIKLVRQSGGSLRLSVVDAAGHPVSGALIGITANDGRQGLAPRTASTLEDGTHLAERLQPDTAYTVNVAADGYTSTSARATVVAGQAVDAKITVLKLDSSLGGVLLSEAGAPMSDIELRANGARSAGVGRVVRTDPTGAFLIERLVAGENVSLYATVDGRSTRLTQLSAGTQDAIVVLRASPARGTNAPAQQ